MSALLSRRALKLELKKQKELLFSLYKQNNWSKILELIQDSTKEEELDFVLEQVEFFFNNKHNLVALGVLDSEQNYPLQSCLAFVCFCFEHSPHAASKQISLKLFEKVYENYKKGIEQGYISIEKFKSILSHKNREGLNIIQLALKSKSDELVLLVFKLIQQMAKLGFLGKEKILELITAKNEQGNNFIHASLNTENPRIIWLSLKVVDSLIKDKVLEKINLIDFLCLQADENLIQGVLKTKNRELISDTIKVVVKLAQGNIISLESLVNIFFNLKLRNDGNFVRVYEVLQSLHAYVILDMLVQKEISLSKLRLVQNLGHSGGYYLHHKIKSVIFGNKNRQESNFVAIECFLSDQGNVGAILSLEGDSYSSFQNCLHLPFKWIRDKGLAEKVSLRLLTMLHKYCEDAIKKSYITSEELQYVLTLKNQEGFTVLHKAFMSASPDIIRIIFKLFDLIKLDVKVFSEFVAKETREGYTFLNEAILSACPETVALAFKLINSVVVDKKTKLELATKKTKRKFTILHDALKSGRTEIVLAAFQFVDETVQDARERALLVMAKTKDGYTILNDAVKSKNLDIVSATFKFIDETTIAQEELIRFVTSSTAMGYNVPHEAIKSGHPQIISATFKFLEKILSPDILKRTSALIISTTKKYNILHSAVNSGDVEVVRLYLLFLYKVYFRKTPEVFGTLLSQKDECGRCPNFRINKEIYIFIENYQKYIQHYEPEIASTALISRTEISRTDSVLLDITGSLSLDMADYVLLDEASSVFIDKKDEIKEEVELKFNKDSKPEQAQMEIVPVSKENMKAGRVIQFSEAMTNGKKIVAPVEVAEVPKEKEIATRSPLDVAGSSRASVAGS